MAIRRSAVITAVLCLGLCVLAWATASTEMLATGMVGLGLIAADAGCRLVAPPPRRVTRSLPARRTRVGEPVDVWVTAAFSRWRPRRAFRLIERLDGHPLAPLTVEPAHRGTETRVAYRITPTRRGEVPVGPLRVESLPVLGAVVGRVTVAPVVHLLVHPAIWPLLPPVVGGASAGRSRSSAAVARREPDIDPGPVRPFVDGDDIRRIHWPSTARSGELIVRTDDPPARDLPLVVVDPRSGDDEVALDRAVSMAASILAARFATGHPARLAVLGDGRSIDVGDEGAMRTALDALAVAHDPGGLDVIGALRFGTAGSRGVIVCSASVDEALMDGVAALTAFGAEVIVVDTASSADSADVSSGSGTVILRAGLDPPTAWNGLMRRRGALHPRPAGVAP